MKERKTVKDLREYLETLDPKFDSASLGVMFPSEERIVDFDIVTNMDVVLSPTKDKERQAILAFGGRDTLDKIEEIYKKRREEDKKSGKS